MHIIDCFGIFIIIEITHNSSQQKHIMQHFTKPNFTSFTIGITLTIRCLCYLTKDIMSMLTCTVMVSFLETPLLLNLLS